jgi:hypothetical protein
MIDSNNLEEFKEDLLEEIDILRLEPVGFSKMFVITIIMIISAITIIILFAIYQGPWVAILLVIAAGLLIMGVYLLYEEIRRLSNDKRIYTFSHDGFKIERKEETQRFISWKEIKNLEIKNRYSKNKRKMKCIIKTKKEEFTIFLYGFNEVTAEIQNPLDVAKEILKYYERI